ncbi:uncharacterized protein LOC111055847 [Nilaparvata lugens]|uniref:uncharacterized protein LOC111055847 n=1 Tax=Nilaparvata lugens TaxID=108931 RepID=UPI000B994F5F|nr:uncharacterized protein LOC111055847 [Nilaparvata lugens]
MQVESSVLIVTLFAISVASMVTAQQVDPLTALWLSPRLVEVRPLPVPDLHPAESHSAWGRRGWGAGTGVAAYPAPPAAFAPAAGYPPMSYPAPTVGLYPNPGGVYGQPGNAWGMRGWGQQG